MDRREDHRAPAPSRRALLPTSAVALGASTMPTHPFADPRGALARPRFLFGKTFSDSRDSLKLELDAGKAGFADLAARGHAISPIPAQSPLAGHPGAIRIEDDGGFVGAHDPRSDGLALGL